ncbi:hypothetical protein FGW37_02180 [Streptomyces rectiverticillatus]|uniref:hypothetical protein n=1 Tax=Streptomyces rectiverticillatus TaxID=173860 RepID=UPI0015C409EA|nr:hypothetical protein [Streptomyces rectiverticillatus]QLE70571.1 hypothetical protein FGW37_02180 [Streptomyces rectiverticillatus]
MENTATASDTPAPGPSRPAPNRPGVPPRRTAGDWIWLTVVAVAVLALGAFVGVLGPLLAIACDSCQDGVRGPLRFGGGIAVAWGAVPLVTLGTVTGIFLPRGGARVGAYGLGALVVLLTAMLILGQYTT